MNELTYLAYQETMAIVAELAQMGIRVTTEPSRGRANEETLVKYGTNPDRLPPEMWWHVTFFADNEEQQQQVRSAHQSLIWKGISFDSGGVGKQRDWEIDWSFHVSDGIDAKREAGANRIEEMLSELEEGGDIYG